MQPMTVVMQSLTSVMIAVTFVMLTVTLVMPILQAGTIAQNAIAGKRYALRVC
jgi:hypothetical protein